VKAIEYVSKYLEYKNHPPKVWEDKPSGEQSDSQLDAMLGICLDLIKEAAALQELRKAKCDSAIIAILKEMNQKFIAFSHKLPSEPIPPGMFKLVLADKFPMLKTNIESWPGKIYSEKEQNCDHKN
jgi:hypothetical protein